MRACTARRGMIAATRSPAARETLDYCSGYLLCRFLEIKDWQGLACLASIIISRHFHIQMQVLIRKPAWFRWGLWNACHHADGMLEAAAESHSESSRTQLRDRDPLGPLGVVCSSSNLVPKLPSTMTKGREEGPPPPAAFSSTVRASPCLPLSQSCCSVPYPKLYRPRTSTHGVSYLETVVQMAFFLCFAPNHGNRQNSTLIRVLRCRLIRSQHLIQLFSICSMMFSMRISRMTCL